MEYPAGSIKHDLASGSVALRTSLPEVGALTNHAWLVATTGSGAVWKTSSDVESWIDLPTPAPPAPVIDAASPSETGDAGLPSSMATEVIPEQPALSA